VPGRACAEREPQVSPNHCLGSALGAWLGGPAISVGLGYVAPLYVGAAIRGALVTDA
jgi:hypothetical protein